MCGRYSLTKLPESEILVSRDGEAMDWEPRYNIAPSNLCPVKSMHHPDVLMLYRWGLVPHWAKDEKIGFRMINARGETLAEKPAFREAFRQRRCVVYADGFFEWKKEGKEKQPFRILANKGKPFAMAGLTEQWRKPDGDIMHSFTIVTTSPNSFMAGIHDRMPVILDNKAVGLWLDHAAPPSSLQSLLIPYDGDRMSKYAVDKAVGNVRNDFLELINPL
ncbi:MAG: SOS response-associated peptidase [Bacteroidia bacterium]